MGSGEESNILSIVNNKLEVIIMEECFNDVAQIDGIASASRVVHQKGGR
jgi:hypothetical protein